MGDAADDTTDQGQESLWAHQRGECGYPCPYCEEEFRCWCGEEGPLSAMCDFAVYEQECSGSGVLYCECGGEFCVCHNHGEVECPGCSQCLPEDGGDWDEDEWDDLGGEGGAA